MESSNETPHFVDLLEYNGNGECSCPHFQIRCQRHYKDNGRVVVNHGMPNATRCKHINTAMMYFADQMLTRIKQGMKGPNEVRTIQYDDIANCDIPVG